MIDSIFLIDDEDLFHIVFDDACSILDITLSLQGVHSADEAEEKVIGWMDNPSAKPDCFFVDLNIIGSSFDGIEFIRRVNHKYGNGVVIGIISSSFNDSEMERAQEVGAQFWIVKSDDIEPRLEEFKADFEGYREGTLPFKVYK
jgi:DNA-binding NarL/FixJ family response regulator